MVRLDPLMNNVTIIHLPGQPLLWPAHSKTPPSVGAKETEKAFLKEPRVVNEGSAETFTNQNVGVTGGRVEMLSEPKWFFEDEEHVGPYSLMSVHESVIETLSSAHHLTTITIGERNLGSELSKKVMSSSKSFILNSTPSNERISKIINHISPELISPKLVSSWSSSHNISFQTEITHPHMNNKQSQVSLLDWDSQLPTKADERDQDRVSTPSSFSSAYTVTEQELNASDSSTNADTQSDSCCNCDHSPHQCCQWSEELNLESKHQQRQSTQGNNVNISYIFINNENETNNNNELVLKLNETDREYLKKSFLIQCGSRRNSVSSNSTSASSSAEQRDKEDEEMWVTNEAAFSCDVFDRALQWVHQDTILSTGTDCEALQAHLLAVLTEQAHSEDVKVVLAKAMATLMCPVGDASLQRKHFTSRQRVVQENKSSLTCGSEVKKESEAGIIKGDEKKAWNKEIEMKETTATNLTSTMGNRPSKRFSFLIRSNSLKDAETSPASNSPFPVPASPKSAAKTPSAGVSASDKAILDRLSQLNLDKTSSGNKPRAQSGQPPCSRCSEPVYPQELVRPTSDLYFHSSCFKCFQCGIKLNLATFYRSPLKQKAARIFCRTHLPAPDGRPNSTTQNKTDNNIVKCDSIGLRYF